MIYKFKKSNWCELLFADCINGVNFYEKYWWSDCYVKTERKIEVIKTLRIGRRFLETIGGGLV